MIPIYNPEKYFQKTQSWCDYYLCSYPIGECAGMCDNYAPKTNKEENAENDSEPIEDN